MKRFNLCFEITMTETVVVHDFHAFEQLSGNDCRLSFRHFVFAKKIG